MSGLEQATARRIWFVPDFQIWGLPNIGQVDFVAVERDGSSGNVMYGVADIGEGPQPVQFGDLVDHRGNNLPATINCPRVLPRARTEGSAFVIDTETATGFRIARDQSETTPMTVDLLVIEMGD